MILIRKLVALLKEEGFHDLHLRYLGGDWVYVIFESELVCSKFRLVVNRFKIVERFIWIENFGLPYCAWNNVVVKKVAGLWGDVYFLEEDIQDLLVVKRVFIKSLKPSLTHDRISMVVEGINYKLVIRELSNLEPDTVCNKEVLDRGMSNISGDTNDEALECEVNESL